MRRTSIYKVSYFSSASHFSINSSTHICLTSLNKLASYKHSYSFSFAFKSTTQVDNFLPIFKMRFTIATVVLSLAAMVVAIPTTESTLFARGGSQTCAQGQTLSCCQSVTSGGDGILGNLLGLNCKFHFVNPSSFTNLQVFFFWPRSIC